MDEAIRRAEAYRQAGADAILMHSKLSTAEEILTFMEKWQDMCPVVIVPTMYHDTPTSEFAAAGVSMVVWANHMVRASIRVMQNTAASIYSDQCLSGVEPEVASVAEIFRLQNAAELKAAEDRYLT